MCISPSTTEIAYALGLGDKIVGVDAYSDYSPEAISKQLITSAYKPDPEEVLHLDLVIMHSYVEAIAGLGVNIIATRPKSLNDIPER